MKLSLLEKPTLEKSNRIKDLDKHIKKAKRGNWRSQKAIFQHFNSYAMSISIRYSNDTVQAEEITNDGFVKMFKNLEKYDSSKPFHLWFRRIVINCAIDHYRKYHRDSHIVDINNYHPKTINLALSNLQNEDLIRCVQSLPPAYRMTFSLSVLEGFSHEEIAKKMDISIGTVKSNLHRARKKLQDMINEYDKMIPSQNNEI